MLRRIYEIFVRPTNDTDAAFEMIRTGQIEMVKTCFDVDVLSTAINENGDTPLLAFCRAIYSGTVQSPSLEDLEWIIQHTANLHATNKNNKDALFYLQFAAEDTTDLDVLVKVLRARLAAN